MYMIHSIFARHAAHHELSPVPVKMYACDLGSFLLATKDHADFISLMVLGIMTVTMPGALIVVQEIKTALGGYIAGNLLYGLGFAGGAVHAGNRIKRYTCFSHLYKVFLIKFTSFDVVKGIIPCNFCAHNFTHFR